MPLEKMTRSEIERELRSLFAQLPGANGDRAEVESRIAALQYRLVAMRPARMTTAIRPLQKCSSRELLRRHDYY